jgi:hypothetical protein
MGSVSPGCRGNSDSRADFQVQQRNVGTLEQAIIAWDSAKANSNFSVNTVHKTPLRKVFASASI